MTAIITNNKYIFIYLRSWITQGIFKRKKIQKQVSKTIFFWYGIVNNEGIHIKVVDVNKNVHSIILFEWTFE